MLIIYLTITLLSITIIFAPIAITALISYFFQKIGASFKTSIFYSIALVLPFLIWPLSGLFEINQKCKNTEIIETKINKVGPVDTLLINGPGMWWLHDKINIERPEFKKINLYYRKTPNEKYARIKSIPEAKLQSRYSIIIEQPQQGNFKSRYITSASITIKNRETGSIIVRIKEKAWGGGIAGNYIGALFDLNAFSVNYKYLSCGYASNNINIYRDSANYLNNLYSKADQKFIEKYFFLNKINRPNKAIKKDG